jgi:hypothetical protein
LDATEEYVKAEDKMFTEVCNILKGDTEAADEETAAVVATEVGRCRLNL